MTDETKRGAKKSNKIKIRLKSSIFGRILISFASALRFFKRKSNLSLRYFSDSKNIHGFNHSISGYVMILIVMAVPVLLFGAKYVLDQRTLSDQNTTLGSGKLVKQCAGKAAKAVAEKWNPALTYAQQREAMLRIADEIYNNSNAYLDSPMVRAVHGINTPRKVKGKVGAYSPIKVTESTESLQTEFEPGKKTVARTGQSTDMKRYYFYYYYKTNYAPMAVKHFDIMYASLKRSNANLFPPDEDLYQDYVYYCENTTDPLGKEVGWYHYVTWPEVVGMSYSDGTPENVGTKSYTKRKNSDDEIVKIEVEGDKIKVTTDDDVAYAEPAKCNVDIILTVPTNSAALNQNNNDKNTSTSGTPYISESTTPTDDAKETPICEITRAYQEFLKENFFYTRGVNVGVIPYSGKVSLRSDRSDWVKAPDKFVDDGSTNVVGAVLYGTKGENGEKLTEIGSFAGENVSYGLLCRGNTENYGSNKITKGDLLLSTENPTTSDIYKFRKMVYDPCYLTDANLLSMKCENGGNKYWMNPYFILEMNPDVKFIYNMLGAFYPYYDDRNVSNFIFIPVTWANNLLQSWSATGGNSAQNTSANSTTLGRLSTPSKGTKDDGRKKALILIVNKPDWFEPGELTYLGFDNDYSETLAVESDLIRFDKGKTSGAKGILEYDSSQGILSFPRKGLLRIVAEPTSGTGTIKFTNVSESYPSATSETSVKKRTEFFITPDKINNTTDNYYVGITLKSTKLVSAEITNRPYKVESGKVVYTALTPPERSVFIDLLKQSSGGKFDYKISGADNSVTPSSYLVYGSDGDGKISDVGIKYQSPTYTPSTQTASTAFVPTLNPDASENPTNWTSIKIGTGGRTFYSWNSVCYGKVNGKGRFVAVSGGLSRSSDSGVSNVAAYSDDGITWHKTQLPYAQNWQSVCYGNGKFVAVAWSGEKLSYDAKICKAFAYSDDGITWKNFPISEKTGSWKNLTWSSVCFTQHYKLPDANKNVFVAINTNDTMVAYGGNLFVSDSKGIPTNFKAISSYKDTLIGTDGSNVFKHNYNGNTWDKKENVSSNITSLAYCSSVVKSLSYELPYEYIMLITTDGKSYYWTPYAQLLPTVEVRTWLEGWTNAGDLPTGKGYWTSVCSGIVGGIPCFVAVARAASNKGTLACNKNLIKWEESKSGDTVTNQQWTSVCWGEVKVDGNDDGNDVGRFVAVSAGNDVAAYSDDGLNWTRVSMPKISFKSVCFGNGKLVAVSDDKYAAYSDDGIEWTLVELGSADWQSVCYGDGKFVAVGNKKYTYSTDGGIKWTHRSAYSNMDGGDWKSICYGDGKFVAVGDKCAAYSEDGKSWNNTVDKDPSRKVTWSSVCYGDGKFVAVSDDKYAAYSDDGKNWTLVELENGDWTSVCYGDGKFVAVDNSLHKDYSTDSKIWTTIPLDINSIRHTSVCYGNGKFVVVSKKEYAFYSNNDVSQAWNKIELPGSNWKGVCYCGKLGRFVAVGDNGTIAYCDVKVTVKYVAIGKNSGAYSSNGIEWYEIETNLPTYTDNGNTGFNWKSVCYGKGEFIVVGDRYIYSTSDGSNWYNQLSLSHYTNSSPTWQSVCYGNGKFVAIGPDKKVACGRSLGTNFAYSTWEVTKDNVLSESDWTSVCYGKGIFVAVGNKKAAYSIDGGESWTEVTAEPTSKSDWISVCYGNKKFVAVSDECAAYSTDGKNWTKVTTKPISEGNWKSVCYGDGKFVAVTNESAAYSIDGINWTKVDTAPISEGLWGSVCYGDGKFVAVTLDSDKVVYSSDGKTWTETTLPFSGNWTSVAAVREEEPEIYPIERGWYFYNNDKSDSTNHHFIFKKNPGDMYFVTNSEEFTYKNGDIYPMAEANGFFIDVDNTYFEVNGGAVTKYLGSGLYRWTMPAEKAKGISISSNANARQFYWSVKNLGDVSLPTLYAGATLPINAALFTGGWQSKDGKWNGVDATTAVKQVTKKACDRLKEDWGNNLRIYLIKYRAQAGDYSYLDDCASYTYDDVSDESGLKTKLTEIAKDITAWATRTEAKNTY